MTPFPYLIVTVKVRKERGRRVTRVTQQRATAELNLENFGKKLAFVNGLPTLQVELMGPFDIMLDSNWIFYTL